MQTRGEQTDISGEWDRTGLLEIEFRSLQGIEDAAAFRALNEEWIRHYFVLEERDREILSDPQSTILSQGGAIYVAHARDEVIGCVALIPLANGVYELSKMAVSSSYRGRGIGRQLLEYTIAQAKIMGAKSLFLGSSRKLQNAVHLYETVGFRHVPPADIPPLPYTRADVFMELQL